MESPTKKQMQHTFAPPAFAPNDARGSLARAAQADPAIVERIRERSMSGRQTVARGYDLPSTQATSTTRKGLVATQSLPSFSQTHSGSFEYSSKNLIAEVYDDYGRSNELLPFGASPSGSRSNSFRAGDAAAGGASSVFGEGVAEEGDGFSMDEIYGTESGSSRLTFGASSFSHDPTSSFSISAGGRSEVGGSNKISKGTKRVLEPVDDDDEMEMDDTDIEDEDDEIQPLPNRTIAGRRAFAKTVSLPTFGFGTFEAGDGW